MQAADPERGRADPTCASPDPRGARARLGVVVPALDEADTLPLLLGDLAHLTGAHRVVVVDGGSSDGTVTAAREGGAEVLRSRPGRARQMNAGAAFLRTPWLLILHADSRLRQEALRAAEDHMRLAEASPEQAGAGYFDLVVDDPSPYFRVIEWGARLRAAGTGLVGGDQGLLIPRRLFKRVGPYADVPIMEDVIMNRRLHRAGRLRRLPASIATSARRYEEEGRLHCMIRNQALLTRFRLGANPARLAPRYRVRRRPPSGSRKSRTTGPDRMVRTAALLVFAKAPRSGQVKTRLAESIGNEAAVQAYRRMGRMVIDQIARTDAEIIVCCTPDDAEAEVREWLGEAPDRYWIQPSGDLGQRMSKSFRRAFRQADRVVIIGTDTPAVDADAIALALDALDSADVVIGPATDGGYYLMGLHAPHPELFDGIAWSTASVMTDTVSRARAKGLAVTFVEVQTDIDTAADLTPETAARLGIGP